MDLDLFKPSPLQADIEDWCRNGSGHALVDAGAGCAKSTTLEWLAKKLGTQGRFFAFNKAIAEELSTRLTGSLMRASTVHSFGYTVCGESRGGGGVRMQHRKYSDMVFPVVKALAWGNPSRNGRPVIVVDGKEIVFTAPGLQQTLFESLFSDASKLVKGLAEKGRMTLTDLSDPVAVDALMYQFDLEPNWIGKLEERHAWLRAKGWHGKTAPVKEILEILSEYPRDWISLRAAFLKTCSEIARAAIARGFGVYWQQGFIDFVDMIWLPVALNLAVHGTPWTFLDEAQDFSACQRALIAMAVKAGGPGARALFVADPDQAIYAFAGADCGAVRKLIEEFHCTQLPLSITYRCPRSVTALARTWKPALTPRDGAPLGIVAEIDWADFAPVPGDLVLSRTTKPLVATCWWLLDKGIPAYVAGRSIGAGLIRIAEDISGRPGFAWEDFVAHADKHVSAHKARIMAKNGGDPDDERIDKVLDDVAATVMLWEIDQADSMDGVNAIVDRLFGAATGVDADERVMLATSHRIKGQEADRVFLLKPQNMPHPMGCRSHEGRIQERNLQYVTVTRAKREFYFVVGKDPTSGHDKDGDAALDTSWPEAEDFVLAGTAEDAEERVRLLAAVTDAILNAEPVVATDPGGDVDLCGGLALELQDEEAAASLSDAEYEAITGEVA